MHALLLIDIQKGFDTPFWGTRNNPNAEDNAAKLLAHWRNNNAPVLHARHISIEEGSPLVDMGAQFKDQVAPQANEPIFEKSVNSAFIGTDLLQHLQQEKIQKLTICGLTTPHCVSTTTRMAANLGFQVDLIADACAAFTSNANTSFDTGPALDAETIHRTALAHLHQEFATVRNTSDVLAP